MTARLIVDRLLSLPKIVVGSKTGTLSPRRVVMLVFL